MTDLSKIYMPITADPFQNNDSYTEIMPSTPLRPYIRCFWATLRPEDIFPKLTQRLYEAVSRESMTPAEAVKYLHQSS